MNKYQDKKFNEWNETDKCYLAYDEYGYLTCNYDHKAGAICLIEKNEGRENA